MAAPKCESNSLGVAAHREDPYSLGMFMMLRLIMGGAGRKLVPNAPERRPEDSKWAIRGGMKPPTVAVVNVRDATPHEMFATSTTMRDD